MAQGSAEENRRRFIAAAIARVVCEVMRDNAELLAEAFSLRPQLFDTQGSLTGVFDSYARSVYEGSSNEILEILDRNGLLQYREEVATNCLSTLNVCFELIAVKLVPADKQGTIELEILDGVPWLDRELERSLRDEIADLERQADELPAAGRDPGPISRTRRVLGQIRSWFGRQRK